MEAINQIEDSFIKRLIVNQNDGASISQMNLFSLDEYRKILDPVVNIVESNSDLSFEEIKELLFNDSNLANIVRSFVYDKKRTTAFSISYGTSKFEETITCGDVYGKEVTNESIFDLASVTKLFTCLAVLKLYSQGYIDLFDKVGYYLPEYSNIKDITINDLLTFQIPLITSERIDNAKDYEEAKNTLKSIRIYDEFNGINPYTDMGAILLKYIIEKVTGVTLYYYIQFYILKDCNMNNTFSFAGYDKLDDIVPTNNSGYYDGHTLFIDSMPKKGEPFDKKARLLKNSEYDLIGHAGLFSTYDDMTNFSRALINKNIINRELLLDISQNKTGGKHILNSDMPMKAYLGKLSYSKNPIRKETNIVHLLSGRAIGSAGYTGIRLNVDPLNDMYIYMASNRTYNRLLSYTPGTEEIVRINKNGTKELLLPNNQVMMFNMDYAYQNDLAFNRAAYLTLQYRFLEELCAKELTISKRVRRL